MLGGIACATVTAGLCVAADLYLGGALFTGGALLLKASLPPGELGFADDGTGCPGDWQLTEEMTSNKIVKGGKTYWETQDDRSLVESGYSWSWWDRV